MSDGLDFTGRFQERLKGEVVGNMRSTIWFVGSFHYMLMLEDAGRYLGSTGLQRCAEVVFFKLRSTTSLKDEALEGSKKTRVLD